VYRGSLRVLRMTGIFTQIPGSNPFADRLCHLADPYYRDLSAIPTGCAFYLVTGISGGVESSLGTTSSGASRLNTAPCP